MLWRGALLDALRRYLPVGTAAVLSTLCYAGAQLGSGSWLVVALAVVFGGLWTAQRLWTRSLLAPLLTHLAWTATVVAIAPVEPVP